MKERQHFLNAESRRGKHVCREQRVKSVMKSNTMKDKFIQSLQEPDGRLCRPLHKWDNQRAIKLTSKHFEWSRFGTFNECKVYSATFSQSD